jgi:hypothetical protein
VAKPAQQLHAAGSAASEAQRSLESRIAQVDGMWSDSARREFEADHLAAIRADARHLRTELDELACLADSAVRQLRSDR